MTGHPAGIQFVSYPISQIGKVQSLPFALLATRPRSGLGWMRGYKPMADWRRKLAGRFPKVARLFSWIAVWYGRAYDICKKFPGNFKLLRGWIKTSPAGLKRMADILEKMGVATLAIGLFRENYWGIPFGLICLYASFWITYDQEEKNKC